MTEEDVGIYCEECGSGLAPRIEDEPRKYCFRCEKELAKREEENRELEELEMDEIAQYMEETEENIRKQEVMESDDGYRGGNYSILEVRYREYRELKDDEPVYDAEYKKIEDE